MPGSGAQTTLQAGNAPAAPLVLHGVVGGGNHLPSGDPNARLPCLFHKKKKNTYLFISQLRHGVAQSSLTPHVMTRIRTLRVEWQISGGNCK